MHNMDKSSKDALRLHFRKLRGAISHEDREQWDAAVQRQVLGLAEVEAASVIFSYMENWGEVATAGITRALAERGKTVLVPDPSHRALPGEGCHALYVDNQVVGTKRYADSDRYVDDVDIFIVPGIVWSRDGYRVGFGAGYFDRLLSGRKRDSTAVGLGFDCQVVDKVPTESWDERVDVLVTPAVVYRVGDKGFMRID